MTGNGDHILSAEDKSIVALFLFFLFLVRKKEISTWHLKTKEYSGISFKREPLKRTSSNFLKRKHSCPEPQIAWLYTWHFCRTPPTTLWNQKEFSLIRVAVQDTWIWAPVSQHHPRKDWVERGVTTKVQSGERGYMTGSNRCDLQMVLQQSQVAPVTYK